jgi:hypothetical protein
MAQYHVTLGGQGLLLDLEKYSKRVLPPFVDKDRSGDASYADLSIEQVWQLTSWADGDGAGTFLEWLASAPDRYRSGTGLDGYSVPGVLKVGPNLNTSYASTNNGLWLFASYKGKLLCGAADGKVYEESATDTWAQDVDLAKAGGIAGFCISADGTTQNILYTVNRTDNAVAKYDGTTWTAAFATMANLSRATAAISSPLVAGQVRSLVSGPRTAGGSGIYQVIDNTPEDSLSFQDSDLGVFVDGGDGTLYVVGFDSTGRRGRLYQLSHTGSAYVSTPLAFFPDNYPAVGVAFEGALYFGMAHGGELLRWTSSGGLELVAKDLTASGDQLNGLAVWKGALWLSARSGTEVRLKRFDGQAWSEPIAGGAVDSGANNVRGLHAHGGDLYVAGVKSGASPIYRARETVYATTQRTLETVLFNAGLGLDDKVFRGVTVNHAALTASEVLTVQYRLEDTGSWTTLGSNTAAGSTSFSASFPSGAVGKLLALRLLITATASTTPTVYEVLVRYVPRPATKRDWRLEARYEGSHENPLVTLDGSTCPQTGLQIETAVWDQKVADGPLTFVDVDGTSYSVWFVDHQVGYAERSQRGELQLRGKLRLVEV